MSATQEEGSGCNEDQMTKEEDGDTVGKEVCQRMKAEDEDLVCEQATTTTGPLSVSRAFEEMTKER